MDFDQILEEIGEFGRYQKTNYLLICLPVMFAAANSLSYVFTAGKPDYRCQIPECDDPFKPNLHESWLPNAVPGTYDKNGYFIPDRCQRYISNTTDHYEDICPRELFNTLITERCNSWVYDPNDRTIVQEWEITCKENDWKLAFVGTTHFAGLVVGTALSGYFADRFGRKVIFIVNIIFMAVTGIAQGLAWDYNSFLVFAFLNAVGTSGVYPLAFILGVEMVGTRKREMSSNVLNYFYAVGEALVGVAAWLMPDWKQIQYTLSAPPLIFIVYYWIVPESVRWLLARNEREKACLIVKRAAQVNKRELSTGLLANFDNNSTYPVDHAKGSTRAATGVHEIQAKHIDGDDNSEIWSAVVHIFRSKRLMFRYTTTMFIWVVNAIVFYGLSLNSTNLSGNKYLNFILVCLVEIPGYTLAWISLKKFGRRYALAGSMLLCAITCVAGGFITAGSDWFVIVLFLTGKLGITSSFSVVYTYTAEIMPTVVRSGGVGVMSTAARFGAMLAPFVPLLGNYFKPLPLLFFGALSLTAAAMALLLPETFHKKLPDTVREAKALGTSDDNSCSSSTNTDHEQQNVTRI